MINEGLLQHVPGCENGDVPYSQEMIGGGKVNRSFLVRTRRGRFVVRLNDNGGFDPGIDRERELVLHTAAAGAGIAPGIIYACARCRRSRRPPWRASIPWRRRATLRT